MKRNAEAKLALLQEDSNNNSGETFELKENCLNLLFLQIRTLKHRKATRQSFFTARPTTGRNLGWEIQKSPPYRS